MASYEGKGATAKVYKEMYNGQWAAVKKVHGNLVTCHDMDREYEIYKRAKHPNVIKLVARPTMHHDYMWHIPMEFIFGEDLEKIMFHPRSSSIQLTTAIKSKIITGMCEGLLHLHNNDIVHQDLKPDNIMVERDTFRPVIIDMGFAKFYRKGQNSAQDRGNKAYAAPEILREPRAERDLRSDVWAMGKIIAELLIGDRIHTKSAKPTYMQVILRGNVYCDVVSRMLEGSPIPRATMAQVIGEIRAAGRAAVEHQSTSIPSSVPVQQSRRGGERDGYSLPRRSPEFLPPNFRMPDNVPHNGTVAFNYVKFGHNGEPSATTQGEMRFRRGTPLDTWWTTVTPEQHSQDD